MKTKLSMKSFIGNLLFIAVLLLIVARFLSVLSGTPFPLSLITANSMSPALMEGDVVAWAPANIEGIQVGDVIVFKSWVGWPEERYVVHRVVEIKTIWNKPSFVTKGDANSWIDQAGPHVVEPYVTDKNFVGKTISIGQQPLKIPFVGIIGIWANEGFKSLAQPTSAKGPLTYVGVFAPLTIAVILLVISFFVLPEKTKTIKEKIRLYIFGFRTTNIKKIFLSFLLIYLILLTAIHFFAYDSTSASLGIGEFPDESSVKLGSISPGRTSTTKYIPVINPGIFPVKGILFGNGELSTFVDRKTFEVEPGGTIKVAITATAPNASKNGTYAGDIMIYSSPLWYIFPEEVIQGIYAFSGKGAVICFDILSACILTVLTVFFIVSTEYSTRKYNSWKIDISWHHVSRLFLKKGIGQRMSYSKRKIKQFLGQKTGWILKIDLLEIDPKKSILASLVIIPMLFLISSELLAAIIASIAVGMAVFFIRCKRRAKIVLAAIISLSISIIYIVTEINYYLITAGDYTIVESMTLGVGAVGMYILVFAILLIPLALIPWYIAHLIRNLKERKDPLLILEGKCDL